MILGEKLLGGQECLLIDSGAAVTGKRFFGLVVNADCVLTSLKTAGNQDLLTQYNLSGKTIAAGIVIPMYKGDPISEVTVSSGSVLGYGNVTN